MNDLDVADSSGHEPITVKAGSLPHGFYDALAGRASSCDNEEYRRGYVIGQASPGEPAKYTVIAVAELNSAVTMSNTALVEQLRRACVVAPRRYLRAQGMPRGVSTGRLLEAAIVAAEVYLAQTETEEGSRDDRRRNRFARFQLSEDTPHRNKQRTWPTSSNAAPDFAGISM